MKKNVLLMMIMMSCGYQLCAAEEECAAFKSWFQESIGNREYTRLEYRFGLNMWDECLKTTREIDNNYTLLTVDGYRDFLNIAKRESLNKGDWIRIKTQLENAILNSDLEKENVNTIRFKEFEFNDQVYDVFLMGWGDNDFFTIYIFDHKSLMPRLEVRVA